jgi:hypothetical protein
MNRASLLKKNEEAAERPPEEPPPVVDAIGGTNGSAKPSADAATNPAAELQDAAETSPPDLKSTATQAGSSPPETSGRADAQPEH